MIAVFHPLMSEIGGSEIRRKKNFDLISYPIGVGREQALKMLERHFHYCCSTITSALIIGVGGGIKDDLRLGDIVLCNEISAKGQSSIFSDGNLLSAAAELLFERKEEFRIGKNFTVLDFGDPIVISGATVVDMEDYWVGLELQNRGIPFLAVRIISDLILEKLSVEELRERIPSFGASLRKRFVIPFLLNCEDTKNDILKSCIIAD